VARKLSFSTEKFHSHVFSSKFEEREALLLFTPTTYVPLLLMLIPFAVVVISQIIDASGLIIALSVTLIAVAAILEPLALFFIAMFF